MDRRQDEETIPVGRLEGRGDRRRAAAVVVVIAAAVVVGLASAQLQPEVTEPVAIVALDSPAPTADPPSTPPGPVEFTPPRMRAAELVDAVRSGWLDTSMIYADARLDVECGDERTPCPHPRLAIDGLALEVVPGTFGTPVGVPVPRSLLVLEVEGTGLVYRGALLVGSNGTPRYEVLAGGSAARPPDPSALTDVAGWLVLDGACADPPSETPTCPRLAMLADDRPAPSGQRGEDAGPAVAVARGAWGIEDAGSAIVGGPFLVRPNPDAGDDGPAWQVVARYDPSRSVRVVIP